MKKNIYYLRGPGVSNDARVQTAWNLMIKIAGILYAVDGGTDTKINLEDWFIKSKYSEMGYSEIVGGITVIIKINKLILKFVQF